MPATALPAVTRFITVSSTSALFIPLTEWILVASAEEAQALLEVGGGGSLFRAAPAYQTAATVRSSPDSGAVLEASPTWVSPDGRDATDITTISAAGKFWIRFGVMAKLDSGSTTQSAEVTLTVVVR